MGQLSSNLSKPSSKKRLTEFEKWVSESNDRDVTATVRNINEEDSVLRLEVGSTLSSDLPVIHLLVSCPVSADDTFLIECSSVVLGAFSDFESDINDFTLEGGADVTMGTLLDFITDLYKKCSEADPDGGGWSDDDSRDGGGDGQIGNNDDDDGWGSQEDVHDNDNDGGGWSEDDVDDTHQSAANVRFDDADETKEKGGATAATPPADSLRDDPNGGDDEEDGDWDVPLEAPSLLRKVSQESSSKYFLLRRALMRKGATLREKSTRKTLYDEEDFKGQSQIFNAKEVCNMLVNAVIAIKKSKEKSGIDVFPVDDNPYVWRIHFQDFPHNCPLSHDLVVLDSMYGKEAIVLEIEFDMHLFPFYPPTVKPVWPRLGIDAFSNIVCMKELNVGQWSPVFKIQNVLLKLKEIITLLAVVDTSNMMNDPSSQCNIYPESELRVLRLSSLTGSPLLRSGKVEDMQFDLVSGAKGAKKGGDEPTSLFSKFSTFALRGSSSTSSSSPSFSASSTGFGDPLSQLKTMAPSDAKEYVAYLAAQRRKQQEILQILATTLIDLSTDTISQIVLDIVSSSCLIPLIVDTVDGATPVSVTKNEEIFLAALSLARGLSHHPRLVPFLQEPIYKKQSVFQTLRGTLYTFRKAMDSRDATDGSVTLNLLAAAVDDIETGVKLYEESDDIIDDTLPTPFFKRFKSTDSDLADAEQHPENAQDTQDNTKGNGADDAKQNQKDEDEKDDATDSYTMTACPLCFQSFPMHIVERHASSCTGERSGDAPTSNCMCPICGLKFPPSEIDTHATLCLESVGKAGGASGAKSSLSSASSPFGVTSKPGFPPSRRRSSKARGINNSGTNLNTDSQVVASTMRSTFEDIEEKMKTLITSSDHKYLAGVVTSTDDGTDSFSVKEQHPCGVCRRSFESVSHLKKHTRRCWMCPICRSAFPIRAIQKHVKQCAKEDENNEEERANIHFARQHETNLNGTQLKAVMHVQKEARQLHEVARPTLITRFKGMGLSGMDLERVLRYIRKEAPIIIHVNLSAVLQFFVKDTHYRNQFETSRSNGTLDNNVRVQWEDRMFDNIYHSSTGFDRVKYGVLNFMNDPMGVRSCYGYGNSYLLLRNVRLRTTFADCDTGSNHAILGSCEFYGHILNKLTDSEMKDLHKVATGTHLCVSNAAHHTTYKEVQIHGPIRFDRDVKALMVNPSHKGSQTEEMARKFCDQNGIEFVWMPTS